jgi:hypothetical protein
VSASGERVQRGLLAAGATTRPLTPSASPTLAPCAASHRPTVQNSRNDVLTRHRTRIPRYSRGGVRLEALKRQDTKLSQLCSRRCLFPAYLGPEVSKAVAATAASTVTSKTPLATIHLARRHRRGRAASGLAQNPQAADHAGLRPPQPGHMLCSAAVRPWDNSGRWCEEGPDPGMLCVAGM